MSFYRSRMGMAWIAPLVQLVGGATQSKPLDTRNPYAELERGNTALTAALAIGGLVLIGGAAYYVLRPRRRR